MNPSTDTKIANTSLNGRTAFHDENIVRSENVTGAQDGSSVSNSDFRNVGQNVDLKAKISSLVESYRVEYLLSQESAHSFVNQNKSNELLNNLFQDLLSAMQDNFSESSDKGIDLCQVVDSENNLQVLRGDLESLLRTRIDDVAFNEKNRNEIAFIRVQCFRENIEKTIRRCQNNLGAIQKYFANQPSDDGEKSLNPYQITKIDITNSDPHIVGNAEFGCERVSIVTFADAERDTFKVVYKPRDIRLDRLIVGDQCENLSLMGRINDSLENDTQGINALPTYKLLALKDEDDHFGVVEYLTHNISSDDPKNSDCIFSNRDEAKNYYKQLGQLEAIARIFGIRDLHNANLIVHAKKPYLIDLEVALDFSEQQQETALFESITRFFDAEYCLTQNWCYSLEDNMDIVDQLYQEEIYLNAMKEGFKEILDLCGKDSEKPVTSGLIESNEDHHSIKEWLDTLPNDLKIRGILMATSTLQEWPNLAVDSPQTLKEKYSEAPLGDLLTKEEKFSVLVKDLKQGNIPLFYRLIQDNSIYYRNVKIDFSETDKSQKDSSIALAQDELKKLNNPKSRQQFYKAFDGDKKSFIGKLRDQPELGSIIRGFEVENYRDEILEEIRSHIASLEKPATSELVSPERHQPFFQSALRSFRWFF